ncbi:O-antigen ligase family protein [Kitasatospora sp. NPDC085895]|uniref:O-antigen ligase family protein n=1 Tax=Kitasatospora sp. NPDC085895 TaxID=3155057 RepID=UPI00344CD46B
MRRIIESLRCRLPGMSPAVLGGTLTTRLLATAMSFVAGVIAARELGVQGRAMLALMVSAPAVLSILTVLGMDNANARFAGTSHTAFRQIVRGSLAFSLIAGSAAAGLWLLLGHHWPVLLLGLPFRFALLAAAMCPATLLTTLLGTAEIGRGRVMTYYLATTLPSLCYLAGVIGLRATGSLTVTSCFLAALAGHLAAATALLVAATVRVHPDGERVPARAFGSFALRAYLPNLIHYGMLRLDVPVIQLLAGSTAVAMYVVALPVAEGMLLMPTTVALMIFPQATSGSVDARAVTRIARTVLGVAAVTAAGAAVAAPFVIPAVYGPLYAAAVPVIWVVLPGLVLFSAGRSLQAYLAATDLLRPVIIATALGAVVNVVLLGALTTPFGAVGAGAADSAGFLVFAALLGHAIRSRVRSGHAAGKRPAAARPSAPSVRQKRREPRIRPVWAALTGLVSEGCRRTHSWRAAGVLADRAPLAAAALLAAATVGYLATASSPVAIASGLMVIVLTCALTPNAGLYTLAAAIPLSQSTVGSSLVTSNRLVALMFVCLLNRALMGREIVRPRPAGTLITVGTVGCLVAATAVAGGTTRLGTGTWQYLLLACAPLLLLPLVAGPGPTLDRALLVFCGGSVILAVIEIARTDSVFAARTDLAAADSAVLAITQPGTANHNAVAALFIMAAAVLLARFQTIQPRLYRWAIGGGIIVLTIGIAYSLSRAAYLAGIAMMVVYTYRRALRGILALGFGATCLVPLVPAAIAARFGLVLGGSTLDTDSAVRLDLWSSALRMFDAHPLFGVGYLNFAGQLPAFYHATGHYNVMFLQFPLLDFAHNTYLTVLSQTGLVGAVGFGSLAALGVRRAWTALRSGDHAGEAALLAMVGTGICSMFGEVLLVPTLLSGLVLIVLAAKPAAADEPVTAGRPMPADEPVTIGRLVPAPGQVAR